MNVLKHRKLLLTLLVICLVGVLFVQFDLRGRFVGYVKTDLRTWLDAHPFAGPITYVCVYVVGVLAFMPGSVMTLVGGAVFGLLWGFVLTSLASTIGAGFSFLIGRYLARDWVKERAGKRLKKVQSGIERDGWKFIAVTRLIPLFPYNLVNYMFGLTRMTFWRYLILSWACMIPGTIAYVYAGYAIGVTISGSENLNVLNKILLVSTAIGVLVLLSIIPGLIGKKTVKDV